MNKSEARALLGTSRTMGALVDGAEVLAVDVPAGSARDVWNALKALHGETGLWPFLTDPNQADRDSDPTVWRHLAERYVVTIAEPWRGDVVDLLADLKADYEQDGGEKDENGDPFLTDDDRDEMTAAHRCGELDLPNEPPPGGSWAADTTVIGLCPAGPGGLDILRRMEWGGACNYDITGAQHEAVLEHWRARFGAELLTLGHDVIELHIPEPPTAPALVAKVAEEQTAYCPDIVDQGTGTTTALAEQQVFSHTWFFWWD